MTIKDFILRKRQNTLSELDTLINELPSEELTQEDLVNMAIEIANNMARIYNNGFDDAVELIEKCDSKFLSRKIPPHILS